MSQVLFVDPLQASLDLVEMKGEQDTRKIKALEEANRDLEKKMSNGCGKLVSLTRLFHRFRRQP
jgi:hypothetical protein